MAANEIPNALHAGGVIQLGPTLPECLLYGGWGIRGFEVVDVGQWLILLDEPIHFDGAAIPPEAEAATIATRFGGLPENPLIVRPGIDGSPGNESGNVAVFQFDELGDPAATLLIINLCVLRLPTQR